MCVHTIGLPGIPMNIRYNHASFVVQWDEVDDADKYLINWSGGGKAREVTTLRTSHTITELTPNTTYNVTVFAINGCGQSATGSDIFIVTTNEIEPSSPVTTNEIEPSSPVTTNEIEPSSPVITNEIEPSSPVTTNKIELSSTVTTNEIELSSTVMSITTMPSGNLIVHICKSKYHEFLYLVTSL